MGLSVLTCYDDAKTLSSSSASDLNVQQSSGGNNDIADNHEFKSSSETTCQALQELDDLLGF